MVNPRIFPDTKFPRSRSPAFKLQCTGSNTITAPVAQPLIPTMSIATYTVDTVGNWSGWVWKRKRFSNSHALIQQDWQTPASPAVRKSNSLRCATWTIWSTSFSMSLRSYSATPRSLIFLKCWIALAYFASSVYPSVWAWSGPWLDSEVVSESCTYWSLTACSKLALVTVSPVSAVFGFVALAFIAVDEDPLLHDGREWIENNF